MIEGGEPRCHNGRVSTDPQPPDPRSERPVAAFVAQDVHRPGAAAERSAVVDLAAIRHNVRLLAELAHPAALMAVVKADAYGHGAVPVLSLIHI